MSSNSELRLFLKVLEAQAYVVRFRRDGFVEALVWHTDEQWIGRGIDRRSALRDALKRMFPSQAARGMLLPAAGPAPTATARTDVVSPRETVAPALPAPSTPPLALPPRVDPPAARSVSPAELAPVLDELAEIDADIVFNLASISRWSPLRQRLKVTSWISRARGLEERVLGHFEAHVRVGNIARTLSQLMKIAWPGQVAALQLDAVPEDCTVRVDGRATRPSSSWTELAEECETAISFLNESAESRREDEEGWFDAAQLDPIATDADQRLATIRTKLEAWTGPIPFLLDPADLKTIDGEPSRLDRPLLLTVGPKLVAIAKEMRWLRGADLVGWGECMGRLRWLAHRHKGDDDVIQTLAKLLEPEHAPRSSWARENGVDPQKSQQKKEKNRLLKVLSETRKGPELEQWLAQALSLGEVLPNPKLLEELRARSSDFLEIAESPPSFERNQRARWSWLRAQLAGTSDGAPTAELDTTGFDANLDTTTIPIQVDAGLERLRAKTRGKRAIYVSNRSDPDLDLVLKRTFEFLELRRVVLSPSRVDSASESIRRGGVDLVLAATGFLPHKADSVLKSACVAADVKYVRVDRGRPQACQRHLMRELGVN